MHVLLVHCNIMQIFFEQRHRHIAHVFFFFSFIFSAKLHMSGKSKHVVNLNGTWLREKHIWSIFVDEKGFHSLRFWPWSLADPDLKLREGRGRMWFTYPAGCSSFSTISSVLPKIRGGGWVPRAPPLDPPLSMKVADQVPCCFHKYRIYQNVPDVMSLDGIFFRARKRLTYNRM